jgi:hypothetical protein
MSIFRRSISAREPFGWNVIEGNVAARVESIHEQARATAVNVLADRTDGKVAQALIGNATEDAVRVHHTIVRKMVEPDAK